MTVEQGSRLRVEVYGQGGWWKASNGQSGQVSRSEGRKGPLVAVAMVTNRFGMDGWELTAEVSQPSGRGFSAARIGAGCSPVRPDPFFNRLRAFRVISRSVRATPQGCPTEAIVTL